MGASTEADPWNMAVDLSWVLLTIAFCLAVAGFWVVLPCSYPGDPDAAVVDDPGGLLRLKALPLVLGACLLYGAASWLNPSLPFSWDFIWGMLHRVQ